MINLIVLAVIGFLIVNHISSNMYLKKAEELGYIAREAEDNCLVVEEGNTRFYYQKILFWLRFYKYESDIEPNEDCDGGTVTATRRLNDKIDVVYRNDKHIESFFCKKDFDDSLFVGNVFRDPLAKKKDSYNYITGYVISQKQLSSIYERGIDICKNLTE